MTIEETIGDHIAKLTVQNMDLKIRLDALKRQRADLLEVCIGLLRSADAQWEANGLGHDWPEACVKARTAIRAARGEED